MSDETRTRILLAAGPIFAVKGFDAATVREICESAQVNVASVNYHFGDKQTLYTETVKHARDLRAEQVPFPEQPQDATTADKLLGFVSTMLKRMLGDDAQPWQTQLMMREMLAPTEDCRSFVEDFFRPRLNILLNILDPAFPTELSEHRRMQFAFSVFGQCLFYRVGDGLLDIIIPESQRATLFGLDRVAIHITNLTLAALGAAPLVDELNLVAESADNS